MRCDTSEDKLDQRRKGHWSSTDTPPMTNEIKGEKDNAHPQTPDIEEEKYSKHQQTSLKTMEIKGEKDKGH